MLKPFTHHSRDPLNDYRVIIDTPPVVRKKIAALKTSFDLDYKGLVIAGGNPFIYLATFSQYESAEQQTVDALHRVALGFMPFRLQLKGFGHIDNSEVFLKVDHPEAVQLLVSHIQTCEPVLPQVRYNLLPRISIAQRLMPWQFEKSWPKYANRHITATFLADKMLLLKRMEGFRSWQILKYLAFQNQYIPMPSTKAVQGSLRLM